MTWVSYWMLGYFAYLEAVLGPVMPFLRGDLHLSYAVASLHFSAFALGAVATGTLGDRVVLRFGRRRAFWGGGAGMALGAALIAVSPVAVGTVSGALLMGSLGGLLLLCIQSSLADRHGESRGVALTEANVMASIFAILASVVVGIFASTGAGWRFALLLPLLVPVLSGTIGTGVSFGSVRRAANESPRPTHIPGRFWAIAGVIFLETGVEWCVAYWGASFLVASGHLAKAAAASAMGAFFLAMVIGRLLGSMLMRRMRGAQVLILSLSLAVLAFLLFWLGAGMATHVVGLFLVGLGVANVYPVSLTLATESTPDHADWASARVGVAGGSAVLLAPLVLGAIADHASITRAFSIALPVLLVALALSLAASRRSDVTPRRSDRFDSPRPSTRDSLPM